MKLRLSVLLLLCSLYSIAQPIGQHNIIKVQRGGGHEKTTALVYDPALEPFYHGVASGDPGLTNVLIWTRVTPATPAATTITGTYQVASDTGFTGIVTSGTFTTDTAKDYTVKINITGLTTGTTYYYRFKALGKYSLVGRAKTLPTTTVSNLKFAVVSCSNFEGGYFNGYNSIAQRNDLDAVIHLGDYIYEYGQGTYGIGLAARKNEPSTEIVSLSDYRTRYSLYRLDKDLIRLHQQHTFINIWDDHESANDSYTDSAENHSPSEGLWSVRKAVSKRVYFEWMPIQNNSADSIYRKISYGNLCDLIMLDTRLEGRTQPPLNFDSPDNIGSPRRIVSQKQQTWFTNNMKQSGARWKVIGNQVLFSVFNVGFAAGFSDGTPDPTNIDSIRGAENLFIDNWESYPIQRKAILDSIKSVNNVVFLTGDSHCSWAFDIPDSAVSYPTPPTNLPFPKPYNPVTKSGYNAGTQDGSWAVEYATPSISSPNFDEAVGAAATAQFEFSMNNALAPLGGVTYNPHCRYVDLDKHGYFILDIRQDSIHADFFYVSRIDTAVYTLSNGTAYKTVYNSNKVSPATAVAPPKTTQDIPTPLLPQSAVSVANVETAVIFSVYPNPAQNELFIHLGLQQNESMSVNVFSIDGKKTAVLVPEKNYTPGVYNLKLSLSSVPAGQYILNLQGSSFNKSFKINVVK